MKKKLICALLGLCLALTPCPALAHTTLAPEEGVDPAPSLNQQVPLAEVRQRCAGGTEYLDKFGVTRKSLVSELSAHQYDGFYLGTPQVGGDWQSPRGDVSYNGAPGMNCAGFVSYALRRAGMDGDTVTAVIRQSPTAITWGSGRPFQYLSGASNYLNLIQYGNLVAHVFETKWELLASGQAEKGDVILRFWTDRFTGGDADNHLMIYWGDNPHEDKVWQNTIGGNQISPIAETAATAFVLIKFAPEPPPAFAGFTDVRAEDWYAAPIQFAKENGFMQGVAPTLFDPAGTVTRAQAVSVLHNMAGRPTPSAPAPFPDIEGHWASAAIAWAQEAGISTGTGDGLFSPALPVTREQVAQLFLGFCTYMASEPPEADPAVLSLYTDSGAISPWALEGMAWAVGYGLLSGKGGQALAPQDPCTRAQLAQILHNYDPPQTPPAQP